MTDPIADMLTRIRNASPARHTEVRRARRRRMKREIAQILSDEGFIDVVHEEPGRRRRRILRVHPQVRRRQGAGRVAGCKRISKPGLRVYARKTEIPRVLGGLGIAILSTPPGDHDRRAGPQGRSSAAKSSATSGRSEGDVTHRTHADPVPTAVEVTDRWRAASRVKGPKGELQRELHPEITVSREDGSCASCARPTSRRPQAAARPDPHPRHQHGRSA